MKTTCPKAASTVPNSMVEMPIEMKTLYSEWSSSAKESTALPAEQWSSYQGAGRTVLSEIAAHITGK